MNTTMTIKLDKGLRNDAKRVAGELGIPLTTIVNAYLKQFVREKNFSLSVYPTPRLKKLAEWKKISEDADRGIGVSGPFTLEEYVQYMDKVRAKVQRRKNVAKNRV